MKKKLLATLALGLFATGCLVKETTHTLYLEPTGEVTWIVLEKDIRSTADEPAERVGQEREYLDAFAQGTHPVALGLRRLGGDVSTTMVRAKRPYTTVTDARFSSVAELAEELLFAAGIPGRVDLETAEAERTLRLTLETELADEDAFDEDLQALVEDLESYRLVLTDGEFIAAQGFRLEQDSTRAVLEEIDEDELERRGGVLELVLSWSVDP